MQRSTWIWETTMRLLLNGASGRLGGEILTVARERGWETRPIEIDECGNAQLMVEMLKTPAVLCDVTLPQGTVSLCKSLLAQNADTLKNARGLVIGTTGHSPAELEVVHQLSERIPVMIVPNFSRGVFLFEQLLSAKTEGGLTVADLARSLGFELACWESHHSKKLDAPSGTAKRLASLADIPLEAVASNRVGHVIGEHAILISGEGEELRLTHVAHQRRLFGLGAADVCQRLFDANAKPGMLDKATFYRQ
jgi:4-hydroxy-tetrahydrodipicolinate reductase